MASFIVGLTAVAAVGAVTPGRAAAQSHANLVWKQLEAVYTTAHDQGYSTRNYILGKLDEGESDSWTLRLYGGNDYAIIGACDGDCKDVDITVLDDDGNVVKRDTSTDDLPVVEFSLKNTGRYTIKVNMYSCSTEPCYFGMGVFYR